jgi:tetratricopeptide (TPR) repeat protein
VKIRLICVIRILLLLVCFIPLLCQAAVESLPEEHPVYRQVQAVYERLVPAFGEGRLPPRLVVVPKGVKQREQVASSAGGNEGTLAFEANAGLLSEGYIAVEERTVEVLAGLGKDRDNALAFLLAHELAHFYLRHGWVGDFGNAFARTDMGRKMMKAATYEEVVKREAEADYFGGFYGYIAGFDTLGVAPKALERIYAAFSLADQLSNYPSRSERVAIAERVRESLWKLIPVYEAGNRLLVLARYEEAARLFAHLAQIFPSREMFNNAGVAYALEAVRLLPPGAVPYVYPFELDDETRLLNQEQSGKRIARAGPEDNQAARRIRLLRSALNAFEQAHRRDSHYSTALVNSAAVESLLGDQDEAIRLAGLGLALARDEGERVTAAHALAVRGIASARSGEPKRARSELEAARQMAPELAAMNISALEGRTAELPADAEPREMTSLRETIAGFTARDNFSRDRDPASFTLNSAEKGEPAIGIKFWKGPDWDVTAIEVEGRRYDTVATGRDYRGITSRGVRVGSPLASLGALYGTVDCIVPSRQGAWYVYNGSGMVFNVDAEGKVAGWFLFALR